jgi:hypothetical protein
MRAIIIITAIAAVLAVPAHAQQTSFTDSTGRYSGSAIRHGNATSSFERPIQRQRDHAWQQDRLL